MNIYLDAFALDLMSRPRKYEHNIDFNFDFSIFFVAVCFGVAGSGVERHYLINIFVSLI